MKWLIVLFLISCNNTPNNSGERRYYERIVCIKSHEEKQMGYHWGYNFLSGKWGWHWGYQCLYIHKKIVCDSSTVKRVYYE